MGHAANFEANVRAGGCSSEDGHSFASEALWSPIVVTVHDEALESGHPFKIRNVWNRVMSVADHYRIELRPHPVASGHVLGRHRPLQLLRPTFGGGGLNVAHDGVEFDKLYHVEVAGVAFQIGLHLSVVQKRFIVGAGKWKVWKGHHLLRQIRLEALIHARVDGKAVLIAAYTTIIDPRASYL